MYHTLFYKTCENYLERRTPFREAHLAYADDYRKNGHLIIGGAFDDPAHGALLVFKGEADLAAEFAVNDPYVIEGVVTEWYVRKWDVVIGN